MVSWIGADARDHRLARLPAGRTADPTHLSAALIDNGVRILPPLIEGETEEVTNGVARIGAKTRKPNG